VTIIDEYRTEGEPEQGRRSGMNPAQRRELLGLVLFVGSLLALIATIIVAYGTAPALVVTTGCLTVIGALLMLDL
jgi:hypothetical protein